MKNIIIVTGGAGFVGSNLIEYLLLNKKNIISIDNYSSGNKKTTSEATIKELSILKQKPQILIKC